MLHAFAVPRMLDKARYFPVSPAPLKMAAGLRRLGEDFGQGARDEQLFQRDLEQSRYLAAKRAAPRERHFVAADAGARAACDAALRLMRDALAREAPEALARAASDTEARDELEAVARAVQEDFAVLTAGDRGEGRTVALDVRFPSGWRPERLAEASFSALHAPVPGFVAQEAAARSMVQAMVERGPYVRFVWTLTTDAELDHHPDVRRAPTWERPSAWHLRVERQVTHPLPEARASLFLIRTYLYAWAELEAAQRATLLRALRAMPDEVRAYKGLPAYEVFAHALGIET